MARAMAKATGLTIERSDMMTTSFLSGFVAGVVGEHEHPACQPRIRGFSRQMRPICGAVVAARGGAGARVRQSLRTRSRGSGIGRADPEARHQALQVAAID